MEEHVHGFVPGHCQHGLFPELATNNFPLFQTRSYQVRDSFLPTVRRLQCCALNLHFICAHGHHHGDLHRQSVENVFQATRRFDASKQHRRSIRRFADHGSVQRPLLYGLETVRVLTGNAVQVIPTFFVGVSLPDIFFSRRFPLASAGDHGGNCDRTDVPYLEHDASHLTDSSLHSEPRERQQCKRNARTKLPPVATKNYESLFQSTGTTRNDAFNDKCAKVQLLTDFQVGHWVASRNSMTWCCRTTAIPSAPPWHACQKAAIQTQNDSCNIDTRVSPDFVYEYQDRLPKKNSSIPWCRGSHMFARFHMENLIEFTKQVQWNCKQKITKVRNKWTSYFLNTKTVTPSLNKNIRSRIGTGNPTYK